MAGQVGLVVCGGDGEGLGFCEGGLAWRRRPPAGGFSFLFSGPRVLPWANMLHPFGVREKIEFDAGAADLVRAAVDAHA